jgi:hypothetical protein
MQKLEYQEVEIKSKQDVLDLIEKNDISQLKHVPFSVGLNEPDFDFAFDTLMKLQNHIDLDVKANAVLGFGYLAMRFKKLPPEVKSIVESALKHEDEFVRGQAISAADDISHFLGWKLEGHDNEE